MSQRTVTMVVSGLAVAALAGCGGSDARAAGAASTADVLGRATLSAQSIAQASDDPQGQKVETGVSSADGDTPSIPATPVDVTALVCDALRDLSADLAKTTYKPEAVLAQFTLRTLGSAPPAQYQTIITNADAVAKRDCPTPYTVVVKASGRASLKDMFNP